MFRSLGVGLALFASSVGAQTLDFMSATSIDGTAKTLGGLSAIETEDGVHALAVSDRGFFFDLHLMRDAAGEIVEVQASPANIAPTQQDTEGLAMTPSETYLSFEGPARIRTLDGMSLRRHPDFRKMPSNRALEALAIDADGRLYTLQERTGTNDAPFPLYVFDQGQWTKTTVIPKRGPFVPVGADFGPDGFLYLLERHFTPIGFRSQIRRFDLARPDLGEKLLLTTFALQHDNLEGITVWTDPNGHIRLTLVSDDNFQPLQRNQVVEYRLME
ncbi:esterase-like activity of phytase family protein [Ascidiaceihabitans sp.]|uniref:esterase-like activity of phytase family protein n=1 Tax=Ascidiaceihabitans sp. TaxID=1872644 RepID=UPI003298D563